MIATEVVVDILASDVDPDCRFRASCCPVSRATARAIPEATLVVVNTHLVSIEVDGHWHTYRLPQEVVLRNRSFDATGKMAPFSFQLRLSCDNEYRNEKAV